MRRYLSVGKTWSPMSISHLGEYTNFTASPVQPSFVRSLPQSLPSISRLTIATGIVPKLSSRS